MPKEFDRMRRIGEQIQRELAPLIHSELKDPRIGMITLQDVRVSKDMSIAKVYFTVLDEQHDLAETQRALDHAAGFLRKELGQRLTLRKTPQLRFYYDESVARGNRLEALIEDAVNEDRKHHQGEDS
jgi:ribosome-binding factor A